MDLDFTGKVALITGGGGGIGRAAALAFAKAGAKVVVVDRDAAAGEATAGIIKQQGGEAKFVTADVTKSADVRNYVKTALDAYGAIDCFFNNAGIEGTVKHTAEYDEAMFDQVIGVNVKGATKLDVPDVIAAKIDVHQAGNEVVIARVLVVLNSLYERGGAIAYPNDSNTKF